MTWSVIEQSGSVMCAKNTGQHACTYMYLICMYIHTPRPYIALPPCGVASSVPCNLAQNLATKFPSRYPQLAAANHWTRLARVDPSSRPHL